MKYFFIKIIIFICCSVQFISCQTLPKCELSARKDLQFPKKTKVLFVVAHQDDEVFMASIIKKHIELQNSVFLIWTSASYQKGDNYKEKRIIESKKFIKKLNISENNCHFLMYPDGSCHSYAAEILRDLTILIKKIDPDVIFIQAYEGGHIDHDVSHFCTVNAASKIKHSVKIFEIPEYSAYKTPWPLLFKMRNYPKALATVCNRLSENDYEFVLSCWELFESQHFPLDIYIRFVSGKKTTFGFEYYRELPSYDYLKIPPTNKIAYSRYLNVDFKKFKSAISPLLNN